MKMPFLLISPKIVPKIQLIKKGGCFEYHAVIADKIEYRYIHRASICPASGMDRRSFFMPKTMGKYMRVMIDSFEEWYANQFKYQKVDGTPPGEELKKTTYSMEELGQRLGLKEATAYELVAKGHFEVVDVLGKRRVTKESFERWYASQTDYRTVEDQELDADIMASTYGLPEMARMLGVHRQTIYYIVANEDFELIKVGRYKRATKESFEKWYQNQTRYQLAEDRQERS